MLFPRSDLASEAAFLTDIWTDIINTNQYQEGAKLNTIYAVSQSAVQHLTEPYVCLDLKLLWSFLFEWNERSGHSVRGVWRHIQYEHEHTYFCDYFPSRFKRDFADPSVIGSGGFGQVLKVKIIADVSDIWKMFRCDFRPPPKRLNSVVSKLDWLIDWITDWLTEWMTDWLTEWLTDWLNEWLIDWLNEWLIDWL